MVNTRSTTSGKKTALSAQGTSGAGQDENIDIPVMMNSTQAYFYEQSLEQLEKSLSEQEVFLEQCRLEEAEANEALEKLGEEETVEPTQLQKFKETRAKVRNAANIAQQVQGRIAAIKMVQKLKQKSSTQPFQDTASSVEKSHGPAAEIPDFSALQVSSRRGTSMISSYSVKTKIRINGRKDLLDLKGKFLREKRELEKRIRNIQNSIEDETDEAKLEEIQKLLKRSEKELKCVEESYSEEKQFIEESVELQLDEAEADEEDEQKLSEDEFENPAVKSFSSPRKVISFEAPKRSQAEFPNLKADSFAPQSVPPDRSSYSTYHYPGYGMPQYAPPQPYPNYFMVAPSAADRRLPEIDGSPTNWGSFKSAYDETSRKYNLDSRENMSRLQASLKGKAKASVEHLMSNCMNVGKIMEVLERRFGRPEFILDFLVEKIRQFKGVELNKPQSVVEFGTLVEALVTNIQSYKKESYLHDRHLVLELLRKLSGDLNDQWCSWLIEDRSREVNLKNFSMWVDFQVQKAELRIVPDFGESSKKKGKAVVGAAVEEPQKKVVCPYCVSLKKPKTHHTLPKCFLFKKLDGVAKYEFAKSKNLCFLCLVGTHRVGKCYSKDRCEVKGCNRRHHTLLHETSDMPRKEVSESEADSPENKQLVESLEKLGSSERKNSSNHVAQINLLDSASLPIIPVILKGRNGCRHTYALLDSGATCSILEEELALELGLEGEESLFDVSLLGKVQRKEKSRIVDVVVAGSFRHAPKFQLKGVRTIPRLGISGISVNAEELKNQYPHLKGMQITSFKNAVPKLIIGYNNSKLFAARKILEDENPESPTAYKSLLGWYVCENRESKDFCHLIMQVHSNEYLHKEIKNFFSLENFGVKIFPENHRSQEEKQALEMLKKHTRKVSKNPYESCLLWKNESCTLPSSYDMAVNRLRGMEKKMDKNPEFARMTIEKFTEYQVKGYLRKKQQPENPEAKRWYLPWFFAYHPNKKPRLVFDGSATSFELSLNDHLLAGPDFLEPLPSVLLRFRRHLYAVTGDIKEMFHQVELREVDRPSQTILFRGMERMKPPEEFEMAVLFFGSACSPSSALYVKNQNALLFGEKYPEIVKSSIKDCYMDDFLSGADTVENAVHLQKKITEIHGTAGFKIQKWNSNSEEVFRKIPSEIRAERASFVKLQEKSELELEKTLGMLWDLAADTFTFKLAPKEKHRKIFEDEKIPTKREVTSIIMSVFDPLGFLAPCKVKGLIILQSIWKTKVGWDDEIPKKIHETWKKWIKELLSLADLQIPRHLCSSSLSAATDIQLHVFVDASEEAFAAAAYFRVQTGESITTPFLMGKSRVAPVKTITIPKMELSAALLGVRMGDSVRTAYDEVKISSTTYWSDSKTVLSWIRSTSAKHKIFIANRVGEILEKTDVLEWRWLPSELNPADSATRQSRSSLNLWLECHPFLLEKVENWPQEIMQTDADSSDTEEIGIAIEQKFLPDLEVIFPQLDRFSSWMRLIRATAAVFLAARKFLEKRSSEKHKKNGPHHITLQDIEKAKTMWIRKSQQDSFQKEVDALQSNGVILKGSRLLCLSPKLNEDNVIVLDGRLNNADISESVKNPPILDPKHYYVRLFVQWLHKEGKHYGQERLVNELRQHAWIISCRNAVRKCKNECLVCRRAKVTPIPPQMGQLPFGRIQSGFPVYFNCGLDYFGPLMVRNKRSTEKRWGVIFSCLATRAVHLELAQSLSTSDFINVFVRFANLRGKPAHLYSDNGTNFIGAENEIRKKLEELDQEKIRNSLQVCQTEWHFIPPAAPHMGGIYERMIQDVKKILYKMLKEQTPHKDVLRTSLAEVTGILNSRPITAVSSSPEDLRCLTPNDILNVRGVVGSTIPGKYEKNDNFRKSWLQVQWLARQFWERWSVEYLPWLAKRQKWLEKVNPLKVGDIVVVLEDNAPRNSWKLGRIVQVFPAKDGQVRSVEVKISHVDPNDPKKEIKISILRRPAVKVCPLGSTEETVVSGERNVTE